MTCNSSSSLAVRNAFRNDFVTGVWYDTAEEDRNLSESLSFSSLLSKEKTHEPG